MDFEFVAIALGDTLWISLAFVLGLLAKLLRMPPMVGFLFAGFLLSAFGSVSGEILQKLSDLGITLLLFTVGLKLNLRTLSRPQVWAVTSIHITVAVIVFSSFLFLLALFKGSYFSDMDFTQLLLIAFALSFSSTVFVVKILEESGETKSLHGRIAIGILIMQDLAAVIFLAASAGKIPSWWALGLLLLIPLRKVLLDLLQLVGHGELLILYGLILSLGGAEIFQMVGVKGDLGALALGVLVGSHPRSNELAARMIGLKDLFLLGFFLSIGLSGEMTIELFLVAGLLIPLLFIKAVLLYLLLVLFNLRARTSLLATANLANYSEFGLIVIAVSVGNGWLDSDWLVIIALAIAMSFILSAFFNSNVHRLYADYRDFWHRLQGSTRINDDRLLDTGDASVAVIGMGRVGTGVYDSLYKEYGDRMIGIDFDPHKVHQLVAEGRQVLVGDPSDADFWDRVTAAHKLKMALLALPTLNMNLAVLAELRNFRFDGYIAASARYEDEIEELRNAGATTVFNIYSQAGEGFADHVQDELMSGISGTSMVD